MLAYLEDREGTLALADLLQDDARFAWHISEQPNLNFGFTDAVYWARFDVDSPSTPQTQNLFLEISYPLLDDIRVYLLQDGTLLREFHVGAGLSVVLGRAAGIEIFVVEARAGGLAAFVGVVGVFTGVGHGECS